MSDTVRYDLGCAEFIADAYASYVRGLIKEAKARGENFVEIKRTENLVTPKPLGSARADSATPVSTASTPEIRRLETELASRRRQLELQAKAPAGGLYEHVEADESGRRIKTFYGDPEACWGPFKAATRRVTGWQTKFHD